MKAKLIIDGKEIEIEISDEQAKALTEKPKKKTGYERVEPFETYFFETYFLQTCNGKATDCIEDGDIFDDSLYATANYYSDETVAGNNTRADKLYRQLRRFAVEHREEKIDWNDEEQIKYSIAYSNIMKQIYIEKDWAMHMFKVIYFDSEETAQLAINTFKDELMWYFTEYKDSL